MKKLLYCTLALLLVSCGNNLKSKRSKSSLPATEISADQPILVKEKLDTALINGVFKLLKTQEHLNYSEIPLNESFIAMTFVVDPKAAIVNFSDSTVNITYNIYVGYDNKNYKGMLNIDGINIAMFDKGNFGEMFYNADSLKQIPLDRFKSYPMKYIITQMYYVKNGELHYWNP